MQSEEMNGDQISGGQQETSFDKRTHGQMSAVATAAEKEIDKNDAIDLQYNDEKCQYELKNYEENSSNPQKRPKREKTVVTKIESPKNAKSGSPFSKFDQTVD